MAQLRPIATLLLILALAPASRAQTAAARESWVISWGASQQIPEPRNSLAPEDLSDATVRQMVHLSLGGSTLRVHLSNLFGTAALAFTSVHIGRPVSLATPRIEPGSDRALTFAGQADVLVPPGAEFLSDPVDYPVSPLSSLVVSYHLSRPPTPQTGHPGSRATTYFVHGDQVAALDLPGARRVEHWYQLSAVDVQAPPEAAAVVALGDSITDGHATTTNGNDRWTDVLAARLAADARTRQVGVTNQGIGGNHLLTDGLGPNVLSRLDHDVLAPAGVRWVIVFEGVNDLGSLSRSADATEAEHNALTARILAAYQQIIARAHAHGLRVIGATITPFGGSGYDHPGSRSEQDRQAVNAWIRAPGHFDALLDFDAVVRDPAAPARMLPADDSGDHLHPGPAGYRAIGESIPLSLFQP